MTEKLKRNIIIISGPNGAGKSTIAPSLLKDFLEVNEFVNADTIAQGLSGFDSEQVAFAAGRVMLNRLKELSSKNVSFAFETTLASRVFAHWIEIQKGRGYAFQLIFLWLPTPAMAVSRVENRVRMGGHHVPEPIVRRRYERGVKNFFDLYRPISDVWRFYDASAATPRLIAKGSAEKESVVDIELWKQIKGITYE